LLVGSQGVDTRHHFLVSLLSLSSLTIDQGVDRHSSLLLIETLTFSFLFHLPIPLALSLFSLYFTTTTLRLFLIYGLHNNTIMEGPNQPPTWPLAPTVEDELSPDDQTTPAGTDTHTADPGTPVNNGGTTTTTNNDAPQTPANAAPADPPVDRVQIILKDQSGTQVAFGVKSNTRMEKVQNAYAERAARPVASLRFHFDGERVLPDDTVASVSHSSDQIPSHSILTTIPSSEWKPTTSSK
jgi:hypothetical protein